MRSRLHFVTASKAAVRTCTAACAALALSVTAVSPALASVAGAPDTATNSPSPTPDATAPSAASRVIISPLANGTEGVAVTFLAPAEGAQVEYLDPNGHSHLVDTTAKRTTDSGVHLTATLAGLQANTSYRYRIVEATGATSPWYTFTTAAADSAPMDFLYFGDAQNGLDTEWKISANTARAAVPNAKLVLHGGDQINHADEDSEWHDWFASQGDLPATTATIAALGNHELSGDITAQAYRAHFTNPDNGPFPIHTSTFFQDYQGVRFITLTANGVSIGQQRAFLKRALETNPHQWSVVMFHQPVFKATSRRNDDIQILAYRDILEKHNVDLVLNGHDHAYARGHMASNETEAGVNGPVYLVASAGSKFYEAAEAGSHWERNGAVRKVWAQGAATYQKISLNGCSMDVTAVITHHGAEPITSNGVHGAGNTLDSFRIDKCGAEKVVS